MSQLLSPNRGNSSVPSHWRTQTYGVGLVVGLILGLMGAYMYTRAAEEDVSGTGRAARIQTGDLLGLGLALLGVMRQVAELGRGPDIDSKKRK